MNIMDIINENRGVIIKRGLIALGAVAGLTIVSKALFERNRDDYEQEDDTDGFDDSEEE